ncbi:hypothetical protein N7523_006799 [Penicillium sp. IBT 18751x]|nr:hypothetical protein N7523_006799 [Penicillium sp. IBT 18751x]
MAWPQSTPGSSSRAATPTVFEQQREGLVREIAVGMEQVLQNMNRLNRNLESIITVGNEFGSVEALWSQFENFMGKQEEEAEGAVQGKRHVSGESDRQVKSETPHEDDESMAQ